MVLYAQLVNLLHPASTEVEWNTFFDKCESSESLPLYSHASRVSPHLTTNLHFHGEQEASAIDALVPSLQEAGSARDFEASMKVLEEIGRKSLYLKEGETYPTRSDRRLDLDGLADYLRSHYALDEEHFNFIEQSLPQDRVSRYGFLWRKKKVTRGEISTSIKTDKFALRVGIYSNGEVSFEEPEGNVFSPSIENGIEKIDGLEFAAEDIAKEYGIKSITSPSFTTFKARVRVLAQIQPAAERVLEAYTKLTGIINSVEHERQATLRREADALLARAEEKYV